MEKEKYQEQVKDLVKKSIKTFLQDNKKISAPEGLDENLKKKRGVFVTLRNKKNNQLRGCIGRPIPDSTLAEALIDSAISSATKDPRFPPIKLSELPNITFEISVMSEPKLIEAKDYRDYLSQIEIGKHGLIVEKGFAKGLLLPQVATEYDWDVETFLSHTCRKAGLINDDWKDLRTKIYSFYLYDKIEGEFKQT
jgi:uncharacterized protein